MAYFSTSRDILRAPSRLAAEMKGRNGCEGPATQDSHSEHLKRVHKKEAMVTPPLGTVPGGDHDWGDAHSNIYRLGCSGQGNESQKTWLIATFLCGFGHEARSL